MLNETFSFLVWFSPNLHILLYAYVIVIFESCPWVTNLSTSPGVPLKKLIIVTSFVIFQLIFYSDKPYLNRTCGWQIDFKLNFGAQFTHCYPHQYCHWQVSDRGPLWQCWKFTVISCRTSGQVTVKSYLPCVILAPTKLCNTDILFQHWRYCLRGVRGSLKCLKKSYFCFEENNSH